MSPSANSCSPMYTSVFSTVHLEKPFGSIKTISNHKPTTYLKTIHQENKIQHGVTHLSYRMICFPCTMYFSHISEKFTQFPTYSYPLSSQTFPTQPIIQVSWFSGRNSATVVLRTISPNPHPHHTIFLFSVTFFYRILAYFLQRHTPSKIIHHPFRHHPYAHIFTQF